MKCLKPVGAASPQWQLPRFTEVCQQEHNTANMFASPMWSHATWTLTVTGDYLAIQVNFGFEIVAHLEMNLRKQCESENKHAQSLNFENQVDVFTF